MSIEPGFHDFEAATYFGDPCPEPSLSQSLASVLVEQSPLHAWYLHPKLGAGDRKATKAMDLGSLRHSIVLGVGKGFQIVEFDDFKKKAAQEERDAIEAEGKLAVCRPKFDEVDEKAQTIRRRIVDLGYDLDAARKEVAAVWRPDGIWARGCMDALWLELGLIGDLKFVSSAHPDACARHMVDYGCDIQRAAYVEAFESLVPAMAGRAEMVFFFCETEPPHVVTPVYAEGTMRELGASKWRRAKERWRECLRTDRWPAYGSRVHVPAPPWAISREMEASFAVDGL